MHIVLLEDDMAIQHMLQLALEDEGYSVTGYPSADECLDALGVTEQRYRPPTVDLLIVDRRLSGSISGLEVVRQIRNTPWLETLPIILTTAATYGEREDLQQELKQLNLTLLEKPFAIDEMVDLIKKLTQPHSSSTTKG